MNVWLKPFVTLVKISILLNKDLQLDRRIGLDVFF